jgi:SpoVK/Ycf46/Vps4 family AAA+-type ATPase
MLPKLKELNIAASRRRTVYCLITNHNGALDSAALRAGRFDHKIGIFPPDALSRLSLALRAISKYSPPETRAHIKVDKRLVYEIVSKMNGIGMELLAKPGNLVELRKNIEPSNGTLLDVLYDHARKTQLDLGPPELSFGDFEKKYRSNAKPGFYDVMQYEQWKWVSDWDSAFIDWLKMKPGVVDLPSLITPISSNGQPPSQRQRSRGRRRSKGH